MSKRSSLANIWVNQTELGTHFGMSAVAKEADETGMDKLYWFFIDEIKQWE